MYKAGDEVTIVLGERGATLLNAGDYVPVYQHTISSHKPKPDLLDEATEFLDAAGGWGKTMSALYVIIQYLKEQREK